MSKFSEIRSTLNRNTKVIENYSFMTLLQISISLFGLLIYPYLIRKLEPESYGLYVFALSITAYFLGFVSFGFTFPALKTIARNLDNKEIKNDVFSGVFTAKIYLSFISALLFTIILFTIPIIKDNKLVFAICFLQIIGEIFFPAWYYQAIQKMKVVTFIQLISRILSLPFIFIFIKSPADCWVYALITTLTVIGSGIISHFYLIKVEKLNLSFIPFNKLKLLFIDALPFFGTSVVGTLKQESITIIIGSFFGMKDVALYDLANKIVLLPRMITMNINKAIFPQIIQNIKKDTVRKIIRFEYIVGILIILVIVSVSYWLIKLLGGIEMIGAYPLSVILSVTIFSWLVVGSYHNFIFIPQNKSYFVTSTELFALVCFSLFCVIAFFFIQSITIILLALALSSVCEIAYCHFLAKKYHFL
jgi:PST family polysaccharide transporter